MPQDREDRHIVPKVWGEEEWIVNNDKYCGKILRLHKGKRCSLHYHVLKDETLLVTEGCVFFEHMCAGVNCTFKLGPGDSVHVRPGEKHRFSGITEVRIIEFSTHHEETDTVRIERGGELAEFCRIAKSWGYD